MRNVVAVNLCLLKGELVSTPLDKDGTHKWSDGTVRNSTTHFFPHFNRIPNNFISFSIWYSWLYFFSDSKHNRCIIIICWHIQMRATINAHIVQKHSRHLYNYRVTKIVIRNHSHAPNAIAHLVHYMLSALIWIVINDPIIIWNIFVIFAVRNMHADLHLMITWKNNTRMFNWYKLSM